MFKKTLIATAVAAGLVVSGAAQADLFNFNPTGGGTGAGLITGAATFDEAPGNDLALNGAAGPGGTLPVGSTIQDLYQANLNSILSPTSTILFANGTGGNFFTVVAGFSETVTGSGVIGTAATNNFSINPGGFFRICVQSAAGNDLTGLGFACANGGANPILTGHAIGGNATQTGFPNTLVPLDQSPDGNNYPGVTTVTSSGAANLVVQIDTANANYFPGLVAGSAITLAMTNSSLITPFNQVNPSARFSSNGTANGDVANNIGTVNGITGPNFQFQADANTSFVRQAVPEPASLTLLGIALAGMGFMRRRSQS